jgi:hypothetical protein
MESRNIYDSDSDSESFESFKASADLKAQLTQMQNMISVLISAFTTIQTEYTKQTDVEKKVSFLSKTLAAIGIEKIQAVMQQANMLVNIFNERKDIFEVIEVNEEKVNKLKENITALDKLFNELWEEATCAPIRLFAASLDQAKPEEVDSVVKTHLGLFSAKKPTEETVTEGEKKIGIVDEKKNSM